MELKMVLNRCFLIAVLFVLLQTLTGCRLLQQLPWPQHRSTTREYWGPAHAGLVRANYAVADRLIKTLERRLAPNDPVLVSTFVSIDDLSRTSSFGRITPEQISSRLATKGYRMIELKMRDGSAYVKKGAGEFFLSRTLKNLSLEHNAQAVLAGTYTMGKDSVYVSAKVVRTYDNAVIAAEEYNLPLSPDIKALLAD